MWDKYGDLTAHTKSGIDFLDHFVAGFIKERGVLEAEYARSLRALVKKYSPKEPQANNRAAFSCGELCALRTSVARKQRTGSSSLVMSSARPSFGTVHPQCR